MKRINLLIVSSLSVLGALGAESSFAQMSVDEKLRRVIEVYEISTCSPTEKSNLSELGRRLFEEEALSGDFDISCQNCHLEEKGRADGLKLAIGVGGTGEGRSRLDSGGVVVPRNAFTLFGRGRSEFENFFWDGKVSRSSDKVFSPFGDQLASEFVSHLAVAAILPLTERDEFIGVVDKAVTNDLIRAVEEKYYSDRYEALSKVLSQRLHGTDLGDALKLEFELSSIDSIEPAHIGNALAEFISAEFGCPATSWESYLAGDVSALSERQKEGALLFFGKARCAGCHEPPIFSDFNFYALGVPQGTLGPHSRGRDLGRAAVTNNGADLYKFRTPPLIKVSETAPYGHNGIFDTLDEVMIFHINPLEHYVKFEVTRFEKDFYEIGALMGQRAEKLRFIDIDDERELTLIAEFLESL